MYFCWIFSRAKRVSRCYNPVTKKIVTSRDVIFDELASWYSPKQNPEIDEDCENEDRDKSENVEDCHRDGSKVG